MLTRSLAGVEGVERAFIDGPWAARYNGEPGPVPADVDVLVIGEVDPDDLAERGSHAEAVLRREVNVRRLRPSTWENQKDPLVTTVREGPLSSCTSTQRPTPGRTAREMGARAHWISRHARRR